MSGVQDFIGVCLALGIPFLMGIAVGVEIVKRRKEVVLESEAGLGRIINEIIEHTTDPLRFTGPGVRVTRQITVTRNGTECRLTFEAQQ